MVFVLTPTRFGYSSWWFVWPVLSDSRKIQRRGIDGVLFKHCLFLWGIKLWQSTGATHYL